MASEVLDPLYAPIEVSIDVNARQANVKAEGLVEAKGTPIIDAFSQKPVRAQINLPDGFARMRPLPSAISPGNLAIKIQLRSLSFVSLK